MVDSTNADVPGFTTAERDISPVLDRVIRQTERRVIVASFASHVHRIQQIIDVAESHGRKVAYVGRSMVRNMKLAEDLGYLHIPPNLIVDSKNLKDYGDKVVLICTGSQGEPLAALSRMANGDHEIQVGKGDTVILASSLIPGNENAVYRVIDQLTRLRANVVHKGNAKVHVSGHAAAGELLYCYNILKPKNAMPVHGEYRHLIANGALAEKTGIPTERVLIVEDGWVVDLVDGRAQVVGAVECGMLFVDGKTVGKITEDDLKDRRLLSQEGFISIFAVMDKETGRIIVGPEIRAKAYAEDDHDFDDVKPLIEKALGEAAQEGIRDTYAMQQVIRRTIGTWVNRNHRRRPVIIPVVIEG
jgi:ribonuclease J